MKPIALFAILGVLAGASACSKLTDRRPPNVVVISVDTLRADSLRAYDPSAPARPVMDGLAERGHVFLRAYSTAPWTLPSHVSLFTGLYPRHHGVVHPKHAFGDLSSFVQTLREHGYQTVGFGGGGYVSARYGFNRGFEIYDEWRDKNITSSPLSLPRGGKQSSDRTRNLFDRAIAFLRSRNSDRPLFLFAHTYAVHDYFHRLSPGKDGEAAPTPDSKGNLNCLLGVTPCSDEKWRDLESMYEDGIDEFDRDLRPFLELIESTLGLSNTFVILLSDHGEGFDQGRSRIHHGGRLHRDQLQVPLVVVGPGVEPGRSDEVVSLVDVRPSILELVGVVDDTEHDGRSFVAYLHRSLLSRLVSFVTQPAAQRAVKSRDAIMASDHSYYWQSGRRRSVSRPSLEPTTSARIDAEFWYIKDRDGEQLYHVSDVRQESSRVDALKTRERRDETPASPVSKPAEFEPSEELVEQLKALGYVE